MSKSENINYDLIDILKFFFACCVVMIHTQLSSKIENGLYLQEILFRLAVPFFYVTSGYLFKKTTVIELKKVLKKLGIIYILGSLVYMFLTYFKYDFGYTFIFDQTLRILFLSADNVMWFIGSLMFSIVLVFHIGKNKKRIIISLVIAFILYLFGLFFTTYSFIPKNNFFNELSTYLSKIFYANRNPIFSGYLYFGIGYFIGQFCKDYKINLKQLLILVPIDLVLLVLETKLIHQNITSLIEYDFLIMHIPTIILILLIVKNIKSLPINTIKIRKVSMIMYYIHIAILFLYQYLINKRYIRININSKKLDLLVLITSIVVSWLINIFINYRRKKVIK